MEQLRSEAPDKKKPWEIYIYIWIYYKKPHKIILKRTSPFLYFTILSFFKIQTVSLDVGLREKQDDKEDHLHSTFPKSDATSMDEMKMPWISFQKKKYIYFFTQRALLDVEHDFLSNPFFLPWHMRHAKDNFIFFTQEKKNMKRSERPKKLISSFTSLTINVIIITIIIHGRPGNRLDFYSERSSPVIMMASGR